MIETVSSIQDKSSQPRFLRFSNIRRRGGFYAGRIDGGRRTEEKAVGDPAGGTGEQTGVLIYIPRGITLIRDGEKKKKLTLLYSRARKRLRKVNGLKKH